MKPLLRNPRHLAARVLALVGFVLPWSEVVAQRVLTKTESEAPLRFLSARREIAEGARAAESCLTGDDWPEAGWKILLVKRMPRPRVPGAIPNESDSSDKITVAALPARAGDPDPVEMEFDSARLKLPAQPFDWLDEANSLAGNTLGSYEPFLEGQAFLFQEKPGISTIPESIGRVIALPNAWALGMAEANRVFAGNRQLLHEELPNTSYLWAHKGELEALAAHENEAVRVVAWLRMLRATSGLWSVEHLAEMVVASRSVSEAAIKTNLMLSEGLCSGQALAAAVSRSKTLSVSTAEGIALGAYVSINKGERELRRLLACYENRRSPDDGKDMVLADERTRLANRVLAVPAVRILCLVGPKLPANSESLLLVQVLWASRATSLSREHPNPE